MEIFIFKHCQRHSVPRLLCGSIEEFVMDEYFIRVYQNNQTLFCIK